MRLVDASIEVAPNHNPPQLHYTHHIHTQAEHSAHPDSACSTVTGTRHTHRQTFKRRQRQEEFRAALAFAMALGTYVCSVMMRQGKGTASNTTQSIVSLQFPNPLSLIPKTASSPRRAATCR